MITAQRTGVAVRNAVSDDAQALVELYRSSWQGTYGGLIPALHLERMISRRDASWWSAAIRSERHFLLLEVAGRIAGYATCGGARGAGRGAAEIYELYMAPAYQGVGLGEHLFEACRQRLDEDGFEGLIVWALVENTEACSFYRRRGGRQAARSRTTLAGRQFEKIAFVWP